MQFQFSFTENQDFLLFSVSIREGQYFSCKIFSSKVFLLGHVHFPWKVNRYTQSNSWTEEERSKGNFWDVELWTETESNSLKAWSSLYWEIENCFTRNRSWPSLRDKPGSGGAPIAPHNYQCQQSSCNNGKNPVWAGRGRWKWLN